MKLLKLIPAAAIVLTAFTTFEAKAFKICLYNNAGFNTKLKVANEDNSANKSTNPFPAGQTKCIKMGDIPISQGDNYDVLYWQQYWQTCSTDKSYSSSDVGETKTYTVSGSLTSHNCEL